MSTVSLLLALVGLFSGFLLGCYVSYKYVSGQAKEELERVDKELERAKGFYRSRLQDAESLIERTDRRNAGLEEELASVRERFLKREDELIRQNQNLAERVASLRQEGLSEGGEDFHVEAPERDKPWSEGLMSFFEGLESPEAKSMAERYIDTRRRAGWDDEAILSGLEESWSV